MDAEQYFGSINTIARKIYYDIEDIKSSYEHLWNTLMQHEKIDIINDTLIQPELTLRYFDSFSSSDSIAKENIDGKNLTSFKIVTCGFQDDNNSSFMVKDVHSSPFSYKTKSQMNLSIFSRDNTPVKSNEILKNRLKKPKLLVDERDKNIHEISSSNMYQKMEDKSENTDVSKNFLSKLLKKSNASQKSTLEIQNEQEEKERLVENSILSISMHSESDEEKNSCESITLLEKKNIKEKGYDFLANW